MKQSHPLPHDKANVIDFSERKSNQKKEDRKDKDYLAARRKVHAAAALLTW